MKFLDDIEDDKKTVSVSSNGSLLYYFVTLLNLATKNNTGDLFVEKYLISSGRKKHLFNRYGFPSLFVVVSKGSHGCEKNGSLPSLGGFRHRSSTWLWAQQKSQWQNH